MQSLKNIYRSSPSELVALIVILSTLSLSGCAKSFTRPDGLSIARTGEGNPTEWQLGGQAIFDATMKVHTNGNPPENLKDLNVALSGNWRRMITRIQPLVTDYRYRVASEERLIVNEKIYSAYYTGPDGNKMVIRTPDSVRVFYNDEESFEQDVLDSTAMTADAFFFFLLGPIALKDNQNPYIRLDDIEENGKEYYRLYTELTPGFGLSERDEMIIWIDKETDRTFRVNFTLEGYPSTKGAHADVTFLEFADIDGYLLPTNYHERVLGPINIHAHSWTLSGIDANRGISLGELNGAQWSGAAAEPAKILAQE